MALFSLREEHSETAWAKPAPLYLILRLLFLFDQSLPEPATIGGDLCLACAKRLSSRLDAVIEQIESEYK